MTKSKTKQDFNLKIRAIREFKGLSQEFVADKLGMHQTQYSKRENGVVHFTAEEIGSICTLLEISPNVIYGNTPVGHFISNSLNMTADSLKHLTVDRIETNNDKYLIKLIDKLEEEIMLKEKRIKELEMQLNKSQS